jgi:hypothetical protein
MNARYYDPHTAHFISPDTIVPDPLNTQALNRYSYVYNSPLSYTDPTGHQPGEGLDPVVESVDSRECSSCSMTQPWEGEQIEPSWTAWPTDLSDLPLSDLPEEQVVGYVFSDPPLVNGVLDLPPLGLPGLQATSEESFIDTGDGLALLGYGLFVKSPMAGLEHLSYYAIANLAMQVGASIGELCLDASGVRGLSSTSMYHSSMMQLGPSGWAMSAASLAAHYFLWPNRDLLPALKGETLNSFAQQPFNDLYERLYEEQSYWMGYDTYMAPESTFQQTVLPALDRVLHYPGP